jgi:hypothetical protein
MYHSLLDIHDAIAWDVDETLLNGPNSSFFRNYIAASPHERHFLVTFRTPRSWAEDALIELARVGLNPKHIAGVSSIPDQLWEAYASRKHAYDENLVGQFFRWKGMEAARLGCTVLVDDLIDAVILGCTEHKIELIDSYHEAFGLLDPIPDEAA